MNAISKGAALLAALVLLFGWAPAQAGTITGTWSAHRTARGVELNLSSDADIHTMHWQETLHLDGAPSTANFTLRREAGTIVLSGTVGNGTGSGQFTFTPSDAFVAGLSSRGLRYDNDHDLLSAASVDLTLQYIDAMRGDGYPNLPFGDLLAFRAVGVTAASLADLRSVFGQISAENVIATTALHVTRSYVDELADMGYRGMSPDDIVAFKSMHIDRAYLQHLAAHGLKNLSGQQVIEMKASGL
ncbi:MAG TPA: hypothetical protein VFH72_07620 [Candidatus Baltobacteraceae bacterium]|nr:hypothetical protein [Candidatus Baltobacteraceae bacterium]